MLSQKVGLQRSAKLAGGSSTRSGIKISGDGAHARSRAVVVGATIKENLHDPEFSLDKAVVLGAAAFGAYLEPDKDQGLERQQLDGCNMRFFDSRFVQEGYTGVLELSNISAKVVSTSDWNSKSDVYITATLGDSFARTVTLWNDENPTYKKSLDIWVPKGKELDDITIRVFDDDYTNADDPLGSTKFKLATLREESNTFELQMEGDRAGDCVVTLTATFLPFGGAEGDKFLETVDEATATTMADEAPESVRGMQKSISAMGTPVKAVGDLVEAWDNLCNLYSDSVFNDKRTIAFIDNPGTGTQVWISRDISERKVVVAFRGTEPTYMADLLADLNISQTPMELRENPELSGWAQFFNRSRMTMFRKSGPAVHAGFYKSWLSVRDTVMKTVDACTGGEKDWHVYVTGHSLGGALAQLCTFELSKRESPEPKYPLTMYNYGGPRVGNGAFVDLYEVKDSWRVHNEHDIVAKIPIAGLMGYKHVDTGVRMLEGGNGFKFTNALNEEVEIREGARWSPSNIMSEVWDTVEDVTDLVSKQKEVVMVLGQGTGAVKAHLEDCYVEGLVACMMDSCKDGNANPALEACTKKASICVARSREEVTEAEPVKAA